MANRAPNLTGQRFGKLVVIGRAKNKGGRAYWQCKCDCGNITVVSTRELRNENPKRSTRSCGCLKIETAHKNNTTHGKSNTRIYKIWCSMRRRCNIEKEKNYCNYGGRGIKCCEEWNNSFENFYNWAILNGYKDNLTIDRINVNGNYEPSNCRWATMEEQCNNTRNNIYITYKGRKQTLKRWSKELKMGYWMLLSRYQANPTITPEELFKPTTTWLKFTYQGKTQTILQWCKELGYPTSTIYGRYYRNKNISAEELFRLPRNHHKAGRKRELGSN